MPIILHLLAITGFLSSIGHNFEGSAAVEYYVTPTPPPNPACPSDYPCYTLEQYRENASQFFAVKGNLTMLFLDGIHNLSASLFIEDFNSVIITVDTKNFQNIEFHNDMPTVTIQLAGRSTLTFSNLVHLQVDNVVVKSTQLGGIFNITNTATVKLQKVHILNSILLIPYKGPQKLVPEEADNQQIDLYNKAITLPVVRTRARGKNTSEVPLRVVNVEQCKLSRSSIRIRVDSNKQPSHIQMNVTVNRCSAVYSQGSALFFEGRNRSKSLINLNIHDSNFMNTTSTSKTYIGMITIRLFSGWVAKVVICNSSFIGSSTNGVNIKAQKGNIPLDLNVENSTFMYHRRIPILVQNTGNVTVNVNIERCEIHGNGYGIEIQYVVAFSMNQTTISMNNGSGLVLHAGSKHSTRLAKVNIEGSNISHNLRTGLILRGDGIKILSAMFNITNTTVTFNENGGMFVEILSQTESNGSQILLHNCTIADNTQTTTTNRETGLKPSASGISMWSKVVHNAISVTIKNVMFVRNKDHSLQPINLQLLNLKRATIQDCKFIDNHGSPIQVHSSKVSLSGNLLLKGNRAFIGGGLSLLDSTILIQNNTNIDFINNTAEHVGGAIFITEIPIAFKTKSSDYCFYQLPDVKKKTDVFTLNTSLNFYNNTSENGGDDIYGAPLIDSCTISDGKIVTSERAAKLFHFHTLTKGYSSSISSNPKRVCLCDENGTPQCANISYIFLNQTRYPGESFNLSLVLVGDEYGTVSGTAYATLLKHEDSPYTLDAIHQSQEVGFKKCNDVEYSIHSTMKKEILVLTASKVSIDLYGDADMIEKYIRESKNPHAIIPTGLLLTPVFVNITLQNCPLGFQLSNNTLSCQCISALVQAGIKNCEISNHTGYVHRSGTVWIMASYNGSESNGVVVHDSCPYHYCKEQDVPIDLRYPDTQCALNHSGILCGGCPPNLSLALGSNQCLPCSNDNHLALLFFFIAAGFLLVIFIKVLDLTVARGTINGLIFYANIVWAYQSILFPAQDNTNLALQFLRAFLAWLNLDFGIETCFITGLTAYWKTWLQFVFPIYVWFIVGFIIVTSHYFTLAGKLFGNNSVPVLATLFLLSYAKLVRAIITVLGFAFLHYPDHTAVVWTFDGNLPYFGLEHTFLFVAALAALLFLWLPYVSTLLLVPWLKRKSHLKPLHWINRWKPFYDAYYGPLKDKPHYWIGLLLIVRGALLVLFSVTSTTAPNINILAMILTPSVLLLYTSHIGNVYKNELLSLLENCFFLNLIFFGSGILYIETFKGSKATILQISVWFAFVQFVCVILFHVWSSLKKHFGKRCSRKHLNPETNPEQRRIDTNQCEREPDQLRESLLESVVQP